MDGVTAYALSKKVAASAVSGVKSMSVDGQTLTINTKDSGVLKMVFPTPIDGRSVTDIDVNDKNQIVFTMSDGTKITSGVIPTVKGADGKPGKDGKNAVSPVITENENNTDKIYKLDITTADGTFTTPNLKGKDGSGSSTGEENAIESIKVNGVAQAVAEDKSVDITVPTVDVDKNYVDTELAKKVNSSDIPSLDEYVTDEELDAKGYLTSHQDISGKVDKVKGKSLIADTEIERLKNVKNYDDTDIKAELAKKANSTDIPAKVSELQNDSKYQTDTDIATALTPYAKSADIPDISNFITNEQLEAKGYKTTDTTYSAGTGISLLGTTFSNSGVRDVVAGSTNGTISVNVNGTSKNVSVKGLGSAAYTSSGSYATSNHSHSNISNAITFSNYIRANYPLCLNRADSSDENTHTSFTYDGTVLNRNAYGYIFADNIDAGYINYIAVGYQSEHDFISYDPNGNRLGDTISLSGGIVIANQFNNIGGDYAEYWEWEDGNTNNEDRVGHFVTFHKSKIRLSSSGDNLSKVGVVSATPSIVGDSDNKEWKRKYEADIFGRTIYEDVEDENGNMVHRMKLNPEYDETQKYIKRKDRPEWDPIGTHGKLVVIDDGTCVEDGFCKPTDGGIATASDDGFYVMERLDENHIRIYIK